MAFYRPEHLEAGGAPSPFLEGTNVQFAWDSTSLGWAKTCPRLYYYSMIEGYRSKRESIHLRFGIEYHKALEEYDKWRAEGYQHDESVHEVVGELVIRLADYPEPDPEIAKPNERVKNKSNLIRTVVWYLDTFEDDTAKTFILKSGLPAVEQTFRFPLEYGPIHQKSHSDVGYLLCGHLDRVVTFNDDLFVMDRKTTTTTPGSYYFERYEPDNQMTLYTLAGQVVLKAPVKGVIIDVAQVAVGFSRFVRGVTYRTQDQLDEWRKDLGVLLRTFEAYAAEGYWPQNDTACDKYGGCRFRDICSRSPSVRKTFLDTDFTQEHPWNPLEIR